MRTKRLIAISALAVLAAACDAETESPEREPGRDVNYTSGEATLSFTGGIEEEATLALAPERGDALLVFGDGEPRLELGGDLEEGENPSAEAAVSIAIDGRTFVNELNGPCIVTVTESSDEAIAGHVGCPQLQDGDIRISVSASFRAEA